MNCPNHGETYLYKELFSDGSAKLNCVFPKCEWCEIIKDRHDFKNIPTKKELIGQWGEI